MANPPKLPPKASPPRALGAASPAARPGIISAAPPRPSPHVQSRGPAKTFAVKAWTDQGQGTKGMLYGPSGMGKTTLASMFPNPIFIGIDDGGRKIRNPKTGEPINAIDGVETFQDIRDVLRQTGLFPQGSTVVLDTVTRAEALGEQFIFAHTKTDQNTTAANIEDYGYGKGYKHLLDAMRLLLADFEPLVRAGVNVLFLAQQSQATVSNLAGLDFLEDGPKLSNAKSYSVRTEVCEWMDYVLRIGHPPVEVKTANKKAVKGKATGSVERMIFTAKEIHYVAKHRPVNGHGLPPVVTFADPADDSICQYLNGVVQYNPEAE